LRRLGGSCRHRCLVGFEVSIDPARYPRLASQQDVTWGSTKLRLRFELDPPDPDLISNVRCAAFVGDRVVLIETEEFGLSAFPGGTLEAGEEWSTALERELLEETGTRPVSVHVVGRMRFLTSAEAPYRPHLPFPEFHQIVTFAEVEVVGAPTNPLGGEHVLSVDIVDQDEASERLRVADPYEAEMLAFVLEVREGR
jgi:8-oxo-dGTP diphosphatase